MSYYACIELSDGVTTAIQEAKRVGLLQGALGDRAAVAWELVREGLDRDEQALFDAEAEGLPAGLLRAISELIVTASDQELAFRFESAPPDGVMEFARKRRIRFTFDIEEDRVNIRLQHTLRHPSWLPAVVMPAAVEAVAQSA